MLHLEGVADIVSSCIFRYASRVIIIIIISSLKMKCRMKMSEEI